MLHVSRSSVLPITRQGSDHFILYFVCCVLKVFTAIIIQELDSGRCTNDGERA